VIAARRAPDRLGELTRSPQGDVIVALGERATNGKSYPGGSLAKNARS